MERHAGNFRGIAALSHPNRQVRTLSAFALGWSTDEQVPFELLDRVQISAGQELMILALVEWRRRHRPSDALLGRLLEIISQRPAPQELRGFILMLTGSDDPRIAPLLVALLHDEHAWRHRGTILMSLSRLDHAVVEPVLIDVLGDRRRGFPYVEARFHAIFGLARLRSQRAVPILRSLADVDQERPVLPAWTDDVEERKRALDRSLKEQELWREKLLAEAALRHIADPSVPMSVDWEQVQPLRPDRGS